MTSEAPMGLYNPVLWYASFPIKAIDVLGEQFEKEALVREQADKEM